MPSLSIVIPALDEADGIEALLQGLQPVRAQGAELVLVDGGSADGTPDLAARWVDVVVSAPRGRAMQMNAGAGVAKGDVLLFLHADTRLPDGAAVMVQRAIAAGAVWGRFDVLIDGRSPILRIVAAMMNLRSRLTGIATGDQAIFVTAQAFQAAGGFPDQPLMEDIELSVRLRRQHPPACLRAHVITSGRRWERRGVWRTIMLMWWIRWRYWRGDSPARLAQAYK